MKEKKQIEEMAGIVKLARDFAFDTVQKILKEPNKYLVIYAGETVDSLIAEYLYMARYRKEKEVAKNIVEMLLQPPYIDFIEKWVIDDIAKKYGIETNKKQIQS